MSLPKSLRSAIYPPLCAILITHARIHAADRSLPECVLTGRVNRIDRMRNDTLLWRYGCLNMLEIRILYLYSKHPVRYPPRSKIGRYLLGRTRIVDRWPPLIRGYFLGCIVHL